MFEFFLEIERTWPSSILFEKGTNVRVLFLKRWQSLGSFWKEPVFLVFFGRKWQSPSYL